VSRLNGVEVADIFRLYGPDYKRKHPLPLWQLKVMSSIEQCRTAKLGGHVEQCDKCEHKRISYNSCRNRHCPKCQTGAREKWLFDRKQELLPIVYYHVVFTIPDEINPLALCNKKTVYNILFRAASETLIKLGLDSKHLGAQLGILAVLHTWGQNLLDHPHLHCIVTGGGISKDGSGWIRPKKSNSQKAFFIHVNILSALFKKIFMAYLVEAYNKNTLQLVGRTAHLKNRAQFLALKRTLYDKKWVTFCKGTYQKTERVIDYLARYTHRVAIANSRIIMEDDNRITFKWRDYRENNRTKLMKLDANEFIRRFLLHILPKGFYKIRYYGLFSNRNRHQKLDLCRKLLRVSKKCKDDFNLLDVLFDLTGIDFSRCPHCQQGHMRIIRHIDPIPHAPP
jgi:hypothetical protein